MNRHFTGFPKDSQPAHKVIHKDSQHPSVVATTDRYTVFMTKGTHIVSGEMAQVILDAIRTNNPDVTVALDVFGNGAKTMDITLVTAHVVSLMKHEDRDDVDYANVSFLRR